MCRRVTCPQCKRPTFAGCGAHIEQVLGDVPKAQRCQCNEQPAKSSSGNDASEPSLLKRFLSR